LVGGYKIIKNRQYIKMNKIDKGSQKTTKKSSSKQKWREIEVIRDRFQLMKELQDDDYSLELDIEDLGL
jgi:hypothetical protein